MIKMMVDGKERKLLETKDPCVICGKALGSVNFDWTICHGIANASCCGAQYQMKSQHHDKPSAEMQALQDKLNEKFKKGGTDYILSCTKEDWIEPLKRALKETEMTKITASVVRMAERFVKEAAAGNPA